MYNIPYFKESDEQTIKQFIQQHPFAMLIGCAGNMPVATQVPLLYEEREGRTFLQGHIMRSTDHYKAFEKNNEVLCVFTGNHTYVSASWYTDPQTASTWNYMSVHAKGKIQFLPEEDLIRILQQTTAHFENKAASPASFEKLSPEYVHRLAKAIIGFEIEVTTVENVFKLSQNRDEESYHNIISELHKGNAGSRAIATEMETRHSRLFDAD